MTVAKLYMQSSNKIHTGKEERSDCLEGRLAPLALVGALNTSAPSQVGFSCCKLFLARNWRAGDVGGIQKRARA